jgi:hypothetical protein
MTRRAEIFRDGFGVPHVVGVELADAYFGLGVAAVEDRGGRLLLHQAFLRGELSSAVGRVALPDPRLSFLDALGRWSGLDLDGHRLTVRSAEDADEWSRRSRYWRLGVEGLETLDARTEELVGAYVNGVNWALRRSGNGNVEYLPEAELAWWAWFEHVIAVTLFHHSNAFAARDATQGVAVLGSDPHYWLGEGHSEAQIVSEADGFQLTGWWDGHVNLGFWGGSNGSVAMGITASGVEGAVIYRERLNETNDSYFDARSARFEKLRCDSDEAGSALSTHHGPLIHLDREEHTGYAVFTALVADMGRNLSQQLGIWRAQSVDDFLAIAAESEYIRGHRVVIDRLGHIGYVSNGPVYERSETVDWATLVDGSDPAGEIGERRLPIRDSWPVRVADPPRGFISSANDPPWVATAPSPVSDGFIRDVFGPGWNELGPRGVVQRRRLAGGEVVDASSATSLAFDTYVPRAELGIAALRRRVQDLGLTSEDADAVELDGLLAAWDGFAASPSTGMTVAALLHTLLPDGLPELTFTLRERPDVESEIVAAAPTEEDVRAYWPTLSRVAERMLRHYGTLTQAWGDVHVFALNGDEIAAAGGMRFLDALFVSGPGWFGERDAFSDDGKIRCVFGSRIVRVTEARGGELTVQSVSISGQSPVDLGWTSGHDRAQAELYSDGRLKRVPTGREEIERASRDEDHARCDHPARETVGEG